MDALDGIDEVPRQLAERGLLAFAGAGIVVGLIAIIYLWRWCRGAHRTKAWRRRRQDQEMVAHLKRARIAAAIRLGPASMAQECQRWHTDLISRGYSEDRAQVLLERAGWARGEVSH